MMVKLCGLCREQDVEAAIAARPDALGFVFWPGSPRAVTAEQVAAWTQGRLPAGLLKVGVFVDQSADFIRRTVREARLDIVQLHGSEDADFIAALALPTWKALHVDRLPVDWADLPVDAFVLDGGTAETPGGVGIRVDTARARIFRENSPRPVILAGGLTPANVAEAVRTVHPWGVDVSSGTERQRGVKDPELLRAFVANARGA